MVRIRGTFGGILGGLRIISDAALEYAIREYCIGWSDSDGFWENQCPRGRDEGNSTSLITYWDRVAIGRFSVQIVVATFADVSCSRFSRIYDAVMFHFAPRRSQAR
ncbi:hypothetical protein E5D57_001688 [Metarhizium anisopliae]|nr:hypothetical protein E5D57_013671 [Metarhizium anisopliae]KAF5133796.1 hypothetical protein E5D57_004423 [Metarhizium anisopliae]KAF5137909.1 hypothetical protein E5D57_001688 [Metarhizium anisopliae]